MMMVMMMTVIMIVIMMIMIMMIIIMITIITIIINKIIVMYQPGIGNIVHIEGDQLPGARRAVPLKGHRVLWGKAQVHLVQRGHPGGHDDVAHLRVEGVVGDVNGA